MKPPADVPFGGRIAEAGFDRVIDFTRIPWIDQARWVASSELDVAAAKGLQMPIASIQFPSFNFLEQADDSHVLVISGRAIPAI